MTSFGEISFEIDERQALGLRRRINDLEFEQCESDEFIAYLQDREVERQLASTLLEAAFRSSRQIGAAVGIVMAVQKVSEDEAFATLSKIGEEQGRQLRLVAQDIVSAGTV